MKKKQKNGAAAPVMENNTPSDFLRRPEYEGYRTAAYRMYPGLEPENLRPKLDAHLQAMFEGLVDDANGDLLDSIIFSPAREAVPDLARQRHEHADILRRLIARRKADREDFALLLAQRKQELQELETEYNAVCAALQRTTGGTYEID